MAMRAHGHLCLVLALTVVVPAHGNWGEPELSMKLLQSATPPDGLSIPDQPLVRGDLDGSPGPEAAVLLAGNPDGAEGELYLGVGRVEEEEVVFLPQVPIGDRLHVRRLAIEEQRILLDLLAYGPDDDACCPTRMVTRRFRVADGELRQVGEEADGTLSFSELTGREWTLIRLDGRRPTARIRITFNAESASGSLGCNSYSTRIEESSHRTLKLGPLEATRRNCPPGVVAREQSYREKLEHVTGYRFVLGRLGLTWQNADQQGTLLYESRENLGR